MWKNNLIIPEDQAEENSTMHFYTRYLPSGCSTRSPCILPSPHISSLKIHLLRWDDARFEGFFWIYPHTILLGHVYKITATLKKIHETVACTLRPPTLPVKATVG